MGSLVHGKRLVLHGLVCVQGRTREQLAAANVEVEACRSQAEVSQAKLQRLERSNAHLRKQRAQMMADLQVLATLLACAGLWGKMMDLPTGTVNVALHVHIMIRYETTPGNSWVGGKRCSANLGRAIVAKGGFQQAQTCMYTDDMSPRLSPQRWGVSLVHAAKHAKHLSNPSVEVCIAAGSHGDPLTFAPPVTEHRV